MVALRQSPEHTVATLRQELRDGSGAIRTEDAPTDTIRFALDSAEPSIAWRGHEIPATDEGVLAFGDFLGVPTPFLNRTSPHLRQEILSEMIQEVGSSAVQLTFVPGETVRRVDKPGRVVLDPVDLLSVAGRVVGSDDAEITRLMDTKDAFEFDLRVPETHDRGVGGHPASATREVGDITTGGLTIGLDRKHNLAPTVQPYLYRLVCTNGMVTQDPGLKVDARGQTGEEILAELEAVAQRAFSRVEDQMAAFYDLQNQRVDNPERVLTAIAREQRIPDRALVGLIQLAASEEIGDNPTMFDLVNLVTNSANRTSRPGGRRRLELAGGAVVEDHAARCGHCQSLLRS